MMNVNPTHHHSRHFWNFYLPQPPQSLPTQSSSFETFDRSIYKAYWNPSDIWNQTRLFDTHLVWELLSEVLWVLSLFICLARTFRRFFILQETCSHLSSLHYTQMILFKADMTCMLRQTIPTSSKNKNPL